jgi:hypothetical protein
MSLVSHHWWQQALDSRERRVSEADLKICLLSGKREEECISPRFVQNLDPGHGRIIQYGFKGQVQLSLR